MTQYCNNKYQTIQELSLCPWLSKGKISEQEIKVSLNCEIDIITLTSHILLVEYIIITYFQGVLYAESKNSTHFF